ncbi:glycosyltransferase family 2 protein [Eggerthellaceae bacterium zg-1084]|uniref:Glycosyltransferase family 2 protein n=1 Tax=Berryella wangjianweii TaxID=2734634 RepID=A0A6M8J0J7_9ACTN|nr:glycosyltransferase [Berryella wangjianweii]NPD31128.1 glycosyltransferase family 2 protein [Berryella wangjianweii]NPD32563.1 glycosyltransferase family 2 protein [Eggerthellaceae bacterium zg-997]QKF06691.1 glycosyltransferase family 2 protein [Berryella wangjianweii]
MPLVSVVVPAYNAERYLEECLGSLRRQTLEDFEVVLVSDGSTDATESIMREAAARDARFRVLAKPNTGYGDSMNVAFSQANGKYVTTLEADDLFSPDALAAMTEAMEADGGLDFVKADGRVFYGERPESRVFEDLPTSARTGGYQAPFDPAADPVRFRGRSGQPGMYRLSYLRRHGIVHNASPGASFQDAGFWAQNMFCARAARYVAKGCYLIRRDNPNSSECDATKVVTICDEYAFVQRRVDELEGIDRARCHRAACLFAFEAYEWNVTRLDPACVPGFFERAAADFRAWDEAGWLDRSLFSPEQATFLDRLMADPEGLAYREAVPQRFASLLGVAHAERDALAGQLAAARAEADELRSSLRYRVGSALAAPLDALRGR